MAYLGPLGEIENIDAEISRFREAENQRMSEKSLKESIWQYPWRWIWVFSEWSKIGLGCFAPFVFEKMIGRLGKRIDDGTIP